MRILSLGLITAMIAAMANAQTRPHVNVLAGHGMPAQEIQVVRNTSQADVPPKLISGTSPTYPVSSLSRRESGYADIMCTVDETGHTRDFSVLNTNYQFFANRTADSSSKKRSQFFIRVHNEPLTIAALRVSNPDRSPARIRQLRRSPNFNLPVILLGSRQQTE